MKNFMDLLKKETLNEDFNCSWTDNGARGFSTTGNALVDFNFNLTSYRNASSDEIWHDFVPVIFDNPEYALKYLFYLGDIRQGIGERRTFRILLHKIAEDFPNLLKKVIALIPEYTRWDYILDLLDTSYRNTVLEIIRAQINEDWNNMLEGKPISLCAKWLKSINTSSASSRKIGLDIAHGLGLTPKKYRQTLSKLRSYLDVVEVKMSNNQWNQINYNTVPSKANLNYKDAFLKHDTQRRLKYLNLLNSNCSFGVKINAKVAFPHEIIHKMHELDTIYRWDLHHEETLEAMWKELMKTLPENMGEMIVVADGSGSMLQKIPNSNYTNLDVAHGFAIACSEKLSGPYKNKYITFSENPRYVDLSDCKTLYDKLEKANQFDEIANTNIEKVFDLILNTAIQNNLKPIELPKTVLICSDMQFDMCSTCILNGKKTGTLNLFSSLQEKYIKYGYNLPKLLFLNTNGGRNKTIPMIQNKSGVILLSGYSTHLLNMIMTDECDPWLALKSVLDSERYSNIICDDEYKSNK